MNPLPVVFALTSSAFAPGAEIPARHTCDGADLAPALQWQGAPAGTARYVLIVDDPDAPDPAAPQRTWVHWVLYDIPAHARGLPEGGAPLPAGTRVGRNDWQRAGSGGPCPPVGRHRYFFKLYALDATLALPPAEANKDGVERAMRGHVLARAELVGTYQRGPGRERLGVTMNP